jgi:hypothetical protein
MTDQQLDDEIRAVRAKIAKVESGIGEVNRNHHRDPTFWTARQHALLIEMARLQDQLGDLDYRRRGFGPPRRP